MRDLVGRDWDLVDWNHHKIAVRLTNCWSIDEWHHVANVRGQDTIEQTFIAILQSHQVDVSIQVICAAFEQHFCLIELLLLAFHSGRKQTVNAQCLTLLNGEGETLLNDESETCQLGVCTRDTKMRWVQSYSMQSRVNWGKSISISRSLRDIFPFHYRLMCLQKKCAGKISTMFDHASTRERYEKNESIDMHFLDWRKITNSLPLAAS